MKFGVSLPLGKISPVREFQSPEAIRVIGDALERANIAGASVTDHPAPSSAWLHNDPAAHDALDPFTALAFVAACTQRVRLLTNIIVLGYRNPFLMAKAASTLQVVSDGRLLLGVGVGYQPQEFEALGVPFDKRGVLADEALQTLRTIWQGGAIDAEGTMFSARQVEPRPVPSPTPPIWVGGGSTRALKRAASFGDGWLPYFSTPTNDATVSASSIDSYTTLADRIARLSDMRAQAGRTGAFDITVVAPFRPMRLGEVSAEQYLEFADAVKQCGVSWVWTLLPSPSRAAFVESLEWYGEEVIAKGG